MQIGSKCQEKAIYETKDDNEQIEYNYKCSFGAYTGGRGFYSRKTLLKHMNNDNCKNCKFK